MKILLLLVSIFCLFENTSLMSIGGVYTASLTFLLFPIIVLIGFFKFVSGKTNKPQKILVISFAFLVFYSLVLAYFYVGSNYFSFYLDRGVRLILIGSNIAIVSFFLLSFSSFYIRKSYFYIGVSVLVILIINVVAPSIVNNVSFLQGTPAYSPDRLRGFTLEASTFGFQLCVGILMLSCYFRLSISYVIPITMSLLILTTSKGALSSLLLATGIAVVINSQNKVLKVFVAALSIVVGIYIFQTLLQSQFTSDIQKYTSVSTRGTMILTAVWSLFYNPLGVGFFGYFDSIYTNGPRVISVLSHNFVNLFNFKEVASYFIWGTVQSVSTKTFFFDWVIYFGLFTVFLYTKFIALLIKQAKNEGIVQLVMIVFVLLSITFYVPLDGRYIALFPIMYLYVKSRETRSRIETDV
ncbi:hypothetical protein [Vibrio viridaestus]|uniref:O-antigen ligase domain-containing protein n=1 Tax=Vibrio viridaestus TaxID=2487322 RepID=A0A3N9U6Z5_9VIBR|nr:hypothetical protein [Vibrio viridaestus]RQW63886.1 hypothetical protein EES38_04575 [Vibrio viridaestus]